MLSLQSGLMFARLGAGSTGFDMEDPTFVPMVVGGPCVAGAAVYGCLYLADALKQLSVKRPMRLVLASLLGSLVMGWGFLLMVAIAEAFWSVLLYFGAPLIGVGLATIPPWLILRFAERRRVGT